jgi:hypothetical protein
MVVPSKTGSVQSGATKTFSYLNLQRDDHRGEEEKVYLDRLCKTAPHLRFWSFFVSCVYPESVLANDRFSEEAGAQAKRRWFISHQHCYLQPCQGEEDPCEKRHF